MNFYNLKLIVLTSRFPYPLEKGDKLRVFNQITQLSKKHEITLIATNFGEVKQEDYNELKKYCKHIHIFKLSPFIQLINLIRSLFSGLPFQVGLFYQPNFKKQIHQIISDLKPDAIYCHLIRMSEYVKEIQGIPKTLDYMDIFSVGMKRRAERSSFPIKQAATIEFNRLVKYEYDIFSTFNERTIISEQDRELIPHPDKHKIHIIGNGVDTNVFYPIEKEKKYDLLFTGNMGYPPNIESAIYAANQILPEVHKLNPNATLLIAGVNPSKSVLELASEKVFVVQDFAHIRDAFAMSRINLAPMLISIGLQNKILQAMAMKMPTVCSPLANNAVQAINGDSIYVANDPKEYAQQIHELLSNPSRALQMSESGYQFVLKHFNWELENEKLEKIIF